jgi:hypothetical protein
MAPSRGAASVCTGRDDGRLGNSNSMLTVLGGAPPGTPLSTYVERRATL